MKRPVAPRRLILCLLAIVALAAPAPAQETFVCSGRLLDADDRPLVGYRVVYRAVGEAEVSVSPPSDENGEYALPLPTDVTCAPVAVISPRGKRFEIEDQSPVGKGPASRRDIRLGQPINQWDGVEPAFLGAERLYLAFAEDTTVVGGQRWEGRLDYADFDSAEVTLGRAIAVVSFPDLSDMEFGASFAIGGVDFAGAIPDQGGATDLDLWAKLRLDPYFESGRTEWAVGAVITLPTGDEDAGLGFDALRSKWFGAFRIPFARFSVAGHAALRVNEDGTVAGSPVSGEVAPAAGLALTVPVSERLVVVGEVGYEGERFEGGEADGRGLLGVNWRPFEHGSVRAAVGFGFDDGAPDTQLHLGYAFNF